MPDLPDRWWRLALGAALAVAAVAQIGQFAGTIRAQGRLRAHAVRAVEAPLLAVRSQIAQILSDQGAAASSRVLALAAQAHPAAEVELFDESGTRLAAQPRPAPVDHRLDAQQGRAASDGALVTVGPVAGESARLLTYARFVSGSHQLTLRVAVPAPDLVEDLRDRRELLAGHAFVVVALVLAAALVLSPLRHHAPADNPRALEAYGEAVALMRRHDQRQSEQLIAERQRLQERIRDAEPMARAGELTSGIVHEVRNGLGTIVGYARLVEQTTSLEQAQEAAGRIVAECATLEAVVRRFIEFARAETLKPETLDLRRMLTRVAAREAAGRPGAEVKLVPGDPLSIVGDEELLERAFENLVRNAREAAGEGGHVWVEARRTGEHATIGVADDGPGLALGAAEVVRPFQTTKTGGLGLGLPLALKIVRLHGGQMDMSPRAPRGLLVTVRLPAGGPPGTPSEAGVQP